MAGNNSLFYCAEPHKNVGKVLVPILSLEFICGLVGNMLALWVFCFRIRSWKTYTVYMLNLVIADLLLIAGLPLRIINYHEEENWTYSESTCRINLFMLAMNRTASICFLTTVSIDRYFKVVHPRHRFHVTTLAGAVKVACLLWVLTILMSIHLTLAKLVDINPQQEKNFTLCRSYSSYRNPTPGMIWHGVLFFMEFLVAFSLIIFCTFSILWQLRRIKMDSQAKVKHIQKLVILIMIMFAICFMPSIVAAVVALLVKILYRDDCDKFNIFGRVFHGSLAFTYMNSVLDPVLYCFSSPSFRDNVKLTLQSICIWKKGSEVSSEQLR
ncbi:HCAR2 protein, partial [Atractosteus spatula]|nr:HCAR2 protein [Atractosteus spatula]